MSEPTQPTPPYQPTYNVRLSQEQISAIISLALPDHDLIASNQLESGKSFNNRIYFIVTKARSSEDRQLPNNQDHLFVLKVSGYYFGATKIQNEVGSLSLFQQYCSPVPVPKVIAYSEDGIIIKSHDGGTVDTKSPPTLDLAGVYNRASTPHSWILMTRLHGRLLRQTDLTGPFGKDIVQQLARHMMDWRTSIPSPSRIGNIRTQSISEESDQDAHVIPSDRHQNVNFANTTYTVGGLLLCHRYSPEPLQSPLSYYTYLVNDQLFRLREWDVLKPLCIKLESLVEKLIRDIPSFSFMRSINKDQESRFTHMDFAPRNILISDYFGGQSPQVTGILDVEFAAFLPAEEEFSNMVVRQPDDWTSEQYQVLADELVRLGCEVPHVQGQLRAPACTKQSTGVCSCDSRTFEGLSILWKVIGDIAPWYIQEGSHDAQALNEEFERAAAAVQKGIEDLNRFLV